MAKRSTIDSGDFADVPATPTRGGGKPGKTRMEKMLDVIERVGNKVPHPVVIFVMLIGLVILLSHVFYMMGASVTYQSINPETHEVEEITTTAQSLLTADGIRFMYAGVVQNFMNFNAVGVIIVAMLGVGVAEEAGLINALIRKLVKVAPRKAHDVHPGVHRHPVEHRRGRRVSGADPARGGGVPEPRPASAGRARRVLRRRRRRVQRQHPDQAAGRHPHRHHQRCDPPARSVVCRSI